VSGLENRDRPLPTTRFVRDAVEKLAAYGPVLLVIDEFGKNLEAFADSRSDADLYLLQELVEWSHGIRDGENALLTITMQHLAFEEYLDSVSQTVRREWAKVQGRFEDIPFIDTPRQTRHLISQVHLHSTDEEYRRKRADWAAAAAIGLRHAGLGHEVDDDLVEQAWPLHPSALLVLPDLCARYGQNERTLFSFLASGEPLAIPAWLAANDAAGPLSDVRLDRVYDYFVESASTMAGTSQTASRWVEIETAIRDATGLNDAERRVLKAVGLLNLVSAGGSVRASRRVVSWACASEQPGTETAEQVDEVLNRLDEAGRITYREFADEFRLWRGSDVDLRSALDTARRRLRSRPFEDLLTSTRTMLPVVAARHSCRTGTLRAFNRVWDSDGRVEPLHAADAADGLLVYVVGENLPRVDDAGELSKPVVAVRPADTEALLETAIELSAIRAVLADLDVVGDDWVARRELTEREAEALNRFDAAFESAVGHNAEGTEWWQYTAGGRPRRLENPTSVTAAISDVCDVTYPGAPPVPSEMLNRHDLTSQGAKARRLLIEGLLTRADRPVFDIDGFPPERAMYDAVFGTTGIHRIVDGQLQIVEPRRTSGWMPAWRTLEQMLNRAKEHRVGIDRIIDHLVSPPVGMKTGAAAMLVVAGIVAHRNEVAVYEHGTYKPRLTPEVTERLLRNPGHFQVKHFAATRGARRETVEALADAFGLRSEWQQGTPTVLTVVGHLVAAANSLTDYARRTRNVSSGAREVRRALLDATEPDVLLFAALPSALRLAPIAPRRTANTPDPRAYAAAVKGAVAELTDIHHRLLDDIVAELCNATGTPRRGHRINLAVRAEQLESRVLDPRLKGLLAALSSREKADSDWAEYIAMAVVGPPAAAWSDEDRLTYVANITELGGTFRRIEAINFDRRALDDAGFDAIRVTITRPDGTEAARVVAVTDNQREAVTPAVADLLNRAQRVTGDRAQAVEIVLGLLAEHLVPNSESGTLSRRARKLTQTGTV